MKFKFVALSKMTWVNTFVTVLGILALLNQVVPPEWNPWIIFATGVVNVILRVWFTDSAVTFKRSA